MKKEYLKRVGLSNDLFDYADLATSNTVATVTKTYCSSSRCVETKAQKAMRNGVLVDVREDATGLRKCPKCGSKDYLFHKSERSRTKHRDITKM